MLHIPDEVLHHIISDVPDPIDRLALISTCQQLEHAPINTWTIMDQMPSLHSMDICLKMAYGDRDDHGKWPMVVETVTARFAALRPSSLSKRVVPAWKPGSPDLPVTAMQIAGSLDTRSTCTSQIDLRRLHDLVAVECTGFGSVAQRQYSPSSPLFSQRFRLAPCTGSYGVSEHRQASRSST